MTRSYEETNMKIWVVRHGQTDLNKEKRMQGRTDALLNATGIRQAEQARAKIGTIHFDAVYSSPLKRAIRTASIIGNVPEEDVLTDERIIETDFGKYELRKYALLGVGMTAYWTFPEIFPAPKSVETISSMVERSTSFLEELESKSYENVLVAAHGGILRAINGYLLDRKNSIQWRSRMHNCEIRVYETKMSGGHALLRTYSINS
jgi:broad specificity phosphatase PhoE